ncbi:hypothetical protein [Candidatus Nanohalococcus occultus]|uniref:hypothetical protein n=1 Tax=Candidatus Nanohalococcus occultus TaxID=2978047 RepID=UPI0039E0CBAC
MAVNASTIKMIMIELNRLSDKGETLGIEETIQAIEDGRTVSFLKNKFGEDIDLSLLIEGDHIDVTEVNEEILNWWGGFASAHRLRRKTGIEENGINLLLAVCIESVFLSDELDWKDRQSK